jgi:NADH-quinone oxidoreductase subunit G
MLKIQIDGKYYEVEPNGNLLETCLAIGLDIPHFCYHPALGSVGACRLCAIRKYKDAGDTKGRIIMSCMEPLAEGMIISIGDEESKAFRAAVIEGLMINHPHDCPVCDEGGECHLQDMTVMTGHAYRRFDFKKRTYQNQELGPFISHEMNRCIQCYRCVRFYKDYAGGKDLNVSGSRDHVYFGRYEDGALESEFSGNLVEVCPTGVFTDKTLKQHYTRKWDLTNAPSVCVHCSLGCNIIASERYGSLRRIMSRYNGAVNGYFICDRGRFGYEFVNEGSRIQEARIRNKQENKLEDVKDDDLQKILQKSFQGEGRIIGIGSPRASLESNYALSVLAGEGNFYHGIPGNEQHLTREVVDYLKRSGIRTPSLKEIEKADAVIVLGEDLTNTAPMMALALRQTVRNAQKELANSAGIPSWNDAPLRELAQDVKSPLFIATPSKDKLDDVAEATFRGPYNEIALLGEAIAALIDETAPRPSNINNETGKLAENIASVLKKASNPLVISGINCGDENVIHAAMNIATALFTSNKKVMLSMALPECNSMGLARIPGKSLDDLLSEDKNPEAETLIILENDLYRRAGNDQIESLLNKSGQIIVIDHLLNATALKADILLPAATFAESEGTLVNNEGRAQRFYSAMTAKGQVKESWRWISELMHISKVKDLPSWKNFDDVAGALVKEIQAFSKLSDFNPDADYRMLNMKMPRQTIRYSGRTAIRANVDVSEPGIVKDNDSPLAFTMEGSPENPPSAMVPFYWTPGWNSVQAMYKYLDKPNGSLKGGDPGIRLLEPPESPEIKYFKVSTEKAVLQDGEWLFVPVYRIFGSEELSSAGPAVSQRIPEPFVNISPNDAVKNEILENELVMIDISGIQLKIKVGLDDSLKDGIAGLSAKLPGMPFIDLPSKGKIIKTNSK